MVPRARPRSYYGRPVIKEPVWTWEVPWYLVLGGTAGAAAPLGLAARLAGNRPLARGAWAVSLAAVAASPPLLVSDLGRPARFLNMLRVVKPTSPMSVGVWLLNACGAAVTLAAAEEWTGRPARAGRAGAVTAAALGPPLATYTAVLLSATAVPAWREARTTLPFLFAGSAAATAGSAAVLATPAAHAAPARLLAAGGVVAEGLAAELMKRRLGALAEPYRRGAPRRLALAARTLGTAGAALIGAGSRRPRAARAGAALALAGAVCERWAVVQAGRESARDPRFSVGE